MFKFVTRKKYDRLNAVCDLALGSLKIFEEENKKLNKLLSEFFKVLDTTEETDSGKEFHPVYIGSCRVISTKRLGEIFTEMKDIIKYEEG